MSETLSESSIQQAIKEFKESHHVACMVQFPGNHVSTCDCHRPNPWAYRACVKALQIAELYLFRTPLEGAIDAHQAVIQAIASATKKKEVSQQ